MLAFSQRNGAADELRELDLRNPEQAVSVSASSKTRLKCLMRKGLEQVKTENGANVGFFA